MDNPALTDRAASFSAHNPYRAVFDNLPDEAREVVVTRRSLEGINPYGGDEVVFELPGRANLGATATRDGTLEGLYVHVDPQHRRKGYAELMFRVAIKYAADNGLAYQSPRWRGFHAEEVRLLYEKLSRMGYPVIENSSQAGNPCDGIPAVEVDTLGKWGRVPSVADQWNAEPWRKPMGWKR